ncbi:hypothetical protein PGB90_010609 [Kerria lacca]
MVHAEESKIVINIRKYIEKKNALVFYNELYDVSSILEEEQFTASNGWLDRWKKRYGIRKLKICEEKLSAEKALPELENFK